MASLLDWFQSFASPQVLLLDGGVSTHLEHVLADRNQVFSNRALWSSSLLLTEQGQQDIEEAHSAFVQAGADIVSTVTYQCHYDTDLLNIEQDKMTCMLKDGIRLAKTAVAKKKYVAASSGCYGAALADGSEYTGAYGDDVTLETLLEFHAPKFYVMMEQSPDAVAFETIPNLLECRAVATLLTQQETSTTAYWICFACQNGSLLNDGSRLEDALDIIQELDPNAQHVHGVGINCCDSTYIGPLLRLIVRHMAKHHCRRVILVYPNSGEEWNAQTSQWKEGTGCTSPQEFADRIVHAIHLVQSTWKGLSVEPPPKMIVGGCCRTSPTTIHTIRQRLDAMNPTES